jgi:hypothetical protein
VPQRAFVQRVWRLCFHWCCTGDPEVLAGQRTKMTSTAHSWWSADLHIVNAQPMAGRPVRARGGMALVCAVGLRFRGSTIFVATASRDDQRRSGPAGEVAGNVSKGRVGMTGILYGGQRRSLPLGPVTRPG